VEYYGIDRRVEAVICDKTEEEYSRSHTDCSVAVPYCRNHRRDIPVRLIVRVHNYLSIEYHDERVPATNVSKIMMVDFRLHLVVCEEDWDVCGERTKQRESVVEFEPFLKN
jgi:hypothetical protein